MRKKEVDIQVKKIPVGSKRKFSIVFWQMQRVL